MNESGNKTGISGPKVTTNAATLSPSTNPSDDTTTAVVLPSYPMAVYLKFAPGGVSFSKTNNNSNNNSNSNSTKSLEASQISAVPITDEAADTYLLAAFSGYPEPSSLSSSGGATPRSSRRKSDGGSFADTPGSTNLSITDDNKTINSNSMRNADWLVHKAKLADDRLHSYIRLFVGSATTATDGNDGQKKDAPVFLPSLSVLANATFGRLTGVPPANAKTWADAMVLQYHSSKEEESRISWPRTEEEVANEKPAAVKHVTKSGETTVALLKRLLEEEHASEMNSCSSRPRRPCGYVFKRGDIAWNCRTCQTDSTCVICDTCFRNSNHDKHEVYFHRTTPGGCCDCGDAEAWKIEGCCDAHKPMTLNSSTDKSNKSDSGGVGEADPEEAVRMAFRGRKDGIETLRQPSTKLPPRLAAALGVVIGAAARCLVDAVDGAGVGADPVQWKLRWADEASRIWNGVVQSEDYRHPSNNNASYGGDAPVTVIDAAANPGMTEQKSRPWKTPKEFLYETKTSQSFPRNYRLQLRLHNDDVHTFDEVIEALRSTNIHRNNNSTDDSQTQSLVPRREAATEMTHHVDADGQVPVKTYSSIQSAMKGYRRLKSRGLHCSVVSTAQIDMELRARHLSSWLAEISAAHPSAAVLVVHALLQIKSTQDLGGIAVWQEARTIPPWVTPDETDEIQACRRRFQSFPPHLASSYVTSDEAEMLHQIAMKVNPNTFLEMTGADPGFYANVPYRLPSKRYRKSPHSLWGTLPSLYTDPVPIAKKHPMLALLTSKQWDIETLSIKNDLTETIYVVDTDLRKQQEADRITSSVFPHKLPGLYLISGVGTIRADDITVNSPPLPSPMEYRHLLAASSFRAPISPAILLLLLDPYPTKQLRGAIHALFLSLLTDARFKCRFAAALGIAYRPLSTLFCAGVGTEADTPLGFTVQIFTAGSLVRALGSVPAAAKLLLSDDERDDVYQESSIGVFTVPIALTVVRCIHTNLLGATKEVHMILNNTASGNDDDSHENVQGANDSLLPALTYVAGEHPIMTLLPTAPDDGFLDSRSTRHKRLPHLLRDLEYVIETPGTAMRILLPKQFPPYQGISLSSRGEEILSFCTVWCRLLRLAQGMDPQKRKISGGHVEYEQNRWLEAFGLSLNFAGTRDALAESPTNSSSATLAPVSEDGSHLISIREAMGGIIAALLKEMKLWLYKEGMLETGLPVPPGGAHGASDLSQVEALQRSTLHVAASQLASSSASDGQASSPTSVSTVALSCATSVKMTESQLNLIENSLKLEGAHRQYKSTGGGARKDGMPNFTAVSSSTSGAVMGDWLRVPHSPLAGDSLSFHLPLHRALAKTIKSLCAVVVPESIRNSDAMGWWKLPVLDAATGSIDSNESIIQHPLVPLIRPILRSPNCRVVWSAGPDCSSQEAQRRRARSRTVSANIAVAKIIHSLADHPIRCLAAAQQIERHLWARNGSSVAGMALNYSNAPLCRSFRDLDLALVQLSASGMSVGLGARRVLSLLINRFSLDGYLCDPERRSVASAGGNGSYAAGLGAWVNPPRLQDPDHASILSESLFSTICISVTELPPPPPISSSDETWLRQSIRRELIHALAAEPRSHSAAMTAASCAVGRRDESDGSAGTSGGGGLFRDVFAKVLKEVGKQKSQGSRASSGPALFELSPLCCDEYDPTFFHLRRQEHQHALDVVAGLRKQKLTKEKNKSLGPDAYCFPLVCQPPKAHPRFIACRLMLHLPPMDAALRRALLFALCSGSWLPPSEPAKKPDKAEDGITSSLSSETKDASNDSLHTDISDDDVAVMTYSRRSGSSSSSPFQKRGVSFNEGDSNPPFSAEIVAGSSVSFLEELQLLTLQVHTLEECASLHRLQPDLDEEAKSISAGLSINSYLGRLVHVPESLSDVWALRPHPDGPLESKGSGKRRGSILGLLIALYEYRADHNSGPNGSQEEAGDGHGGARALTGNGLKWLLRFVNALVDGAPSVAAAVKSATNGIPMKPNTSSKATGGESSSGMTIWTIDDTVRLTISGMLSNLSDLWPKAVDSSIQKESCANEEKKERGKVAQQRVLKLMKKKQKAFVATMGTSESGGKDKESQEEEDDLCIICRCDDADGENNGPLGFLGHVQRSRVAQMRACSEAIGKANTGIDSHSLFQRYRVVGHMGCQVRETEAMDSKPVFCLKRGTIVSVLKNTVSEKYDIMSRRVLVNHVSEETRKATEGWASIQSSQGYVILSPLVSLCYENTRWGSTRPIVRQCGHAAHLKCVETHTLSLHQRAAGDQPYDGRFAANIDDGEFLCPLCKQLSNILIPRDGCAIIKGASDGVKDESSSKSMQPILKSLEDKFQNLLTRGTFLGKEEAELYSDMGQKALADFGAHLLQAMDVPWERAGSKKRKNRRWHNAIQRWNYEEENDEESSEGPTTVKSILHLFRQQHIAWAAIGHSAAAAEAAVRGVEEVLPFGSFSKTDEPWSGYKTDKESNPMLLELTRTMTGTAGLFEVLMFEMAVQLGGDNNGFDGTKPSVLGKCLANILCGYVWTQDIKNAPNGAMDFKERERLALWSEVTALMSAIPCHVARDGMLSQRHEARATAAQMWVSKGLGTNPNPIGYPPTPLAISKCVKNVAPRPPVMERNWGTLAPTANEESPSMIPFRPAVATAFLYTPLLAWDLNVLAGAIFSSILVNRNNDIPSSDEIMDCGRLLITGRMIQTLITPSGFDSIDGMEIDEEDEEGRWNLDEMQTEGKALAKLYAHCKARVLSGSLDSNTKLKQGIQVSSQSNLFGNVGRAILPFARSVILMMRACYSAANSRVRRKGSTGKELSSKTSQVFESFLDGTETMTTNDGMFILKEMRALMPSALVDESNAYWGVINRWLTAVIGLEKHHGSSGNSVLPELYSPADLSKKNDTDKMLVDSHEDSVNKKGRDNILTAENSTQPDESTKEQHSPVSSSGYESNNVSNEDVRQNEIPAMAQFYNDSLGEESDEELVEEMDIDDAEELIDFVDQDIGVASSTGGIDGEDSGDEPSSSGSDEGGNYDTSHLFAGLEQSPIISYQPSLLAQASIGPGKQGSMLEATAASSVMSDLSHLGLIHRKDTPTFSLIRLPKSFVELYGIVSKVKGREELTSMDDSDDIGNSETAICLLTGTVMRSGSTRRPYHRSQRPPGACTIHARKTGSGIGIFFLVQKCTVLLMHNNKSAYSASLYVDEHGEEDPSLRRGRPLFLNNARHRALEQLWRQQGIPREVAQIRSTSDRVIRDNWY